MTITVQLKSKGTYFVVSVQDPRHLLEQGGGGLIEVHARHLHALTVMVDQGADATGPGEEERAHKYLASLR